MAKVSVNSNGGRLRLVFTPPGSRRRKFLYLGMNDTPLNRSMAQSTALQLEGDIVTGNYDATLEKYKPSKHRTNNQKVLSIWDKYRNFKADRVKASSLEKYDWTRPYIERFFGDRTIENLTQADADNFTRYLLENVSPLIAKQRLSLVKGAFEWAINREMLQINPFRNSLELIKVPPKRPPEPFTQAEVKRIIAGFQGHRHYHYYVDFVRFQFGCGARFGETAALRWEHLNTTCTHIWIGESYSRGELGATKTNEQREFDLPNSLASILYQRRGEAKATDLVFPAPGGGHMCDRNFRNRAWKKTLKASNVIYRKPYLTRSTFISHCSAMGWTPADIAAITGHDPEILIRYYLGGVHGKKSAPEMPYFSAEAEVTEEINQFEKTNKSLEDLNESFLIR